MNRGKRRVRMQLKFSNRGNTLVIGIQGDLDHHSAEYMRQKVDPQLIKSSTKNVVFDFEKVNFMDSSGIGVLMGRYKNILKINGKVAIVNVNDVTRRLLEMSGILKLIPMYGGIHEAMEKF